MLDPAEAKVEGSAEGTRTSNLGLLTPPGATKLVVHLSLPRPITVQFFILRSVTPCHFSRYVLSLCLRRTGTRASSILRQIADVCY